MLKAARETTPDISEAEFTLQLIGTKANPGVARLCGWRAYHTLRSKGSEAGYPDWTLARERVVFIETKGSHTPVTDAQKSWVRQLLAAGAEAYILRPEHLEDASKVLAMRGRPTTNDGLAARERLRDYTEQAIR